MRRRLAVLIVVAGVILGGMVSISSPFGGGLVVIRRPIVLLQDAAERVVRALLGRRGTSGPDQTGASHPAAASVAANAGPEILITVELPADAAPRPTRARRETGAEHDGHEAADRRQSQTQAEGDSRGPGHSGPLRIAGRDQSDADAAAQERMAPHIPPTGHHSGGAADPSSTAGANDGAADVKAPSVGHAGSDGRGSDSPGRSEPGQGGELGGGEHRDGDHGDGDRGDRDHK